MQYLPTSRVSAVKYGIGDLSCTGQYLPCTGQRLSDSGQYLPGRMPRTGQYMPNEHLPECSAYCTETGFNMPGSESLLCTCGNLPNTSF